jgi:hypothetical protein
VLVFASTAKHSGGAASEPAALDCFAFGSQ